MTVGIIDWIGILFLGYEVYNICKIHRIMYHYENAKILLPARSFDIFAKYKNINSRSTKRKKMH